MWTLQRPFPGKVDAIQLTKEEPESLSEMWRLLGACAFYLIWIVHHAHIADPLYHQLRKGKRFEWTLEHTKVMRKLKKALRKSGALKKPEYAPSIIFTIDTSPIRIGWVINPDDADGTRYLDGLEKKT